MKMTFSKVVTELEHTPFATFTNRAISRDSFHNWRWNGGLPWIWLVKQRGSPGPLIATNVQR